MIKRQVFVGFLVGVAANFIGVILYTLILSDLDLVTAFKDAIRNNYLGKVIALGAALNFLPFFLFLRKKMDYHARGVLLATLITAVGLAILMIV